MEYRKTDSLRLIETSDGSHSLYVEAMNETYHSFKGAVQESRYVFISKGLDFVLALLPPAQTVKILEVGFGTGLNALLTQSFAELNSLAVHYTSLEPYPLPSEITSRLNHGRLLPEAGAEAVFGQLHEAEWEKPVSISPCFTLQKTAARLQDYSPAPETFDLVYFDAFAPNKQSDMWTQEVLQGVLNAMKRGAVLVTYCASGQFKRDLTALGFVLETLPGPPGKKEMTRATRP